MRLGVQHGRRAAACLTAALLVFGPVTALARRATRDTKSRQTTTVAQRTPSRTVRDPAPRSTDSTATVTRSLAEQERTLRDLRAQIVDLRKRDGELGTKEKNTAKELRLLQQKVAVNADLLRSLSGMQDRLELQLDGIRAEHGRASEILGERKQRLARTLRAMYERGTPTMAEVVLRTASVRYALSNFKYMELLARNNERLLREIRQQEEYLAATNARLTQTLSELTANAEETRQEKQELAVAQRAQQTALKRVRQQRAEYQSALSDLAAAEKKVQSVIAALEKKRQAAQAAGRAADTFPDVGFARLRGAMPWPVRGRVMTGFGSQKHPKYGTVTFNGGLDISAPEGAPVRVVARGQVEYAKWTDGYGRTIIVNHGGGYYTVYAHLSEVLVAEAQSVEPGALIGRVGDTGSLDGVKLHFEVWERAEAVDPRRWLGR
jgi:murein DD-endopeptidase MepM/ murein hydrolase activator NlpD